MTDHKPITTILGPKQGVPTLAAARLQRWSLLLSGYQYDIQYHCSEDHANCDLLSRLPIKSNENNNECKDQDVYYSEVMDEHPISNHDIAMITTPCFGPRMVVIGL
jgi:hypothetical protein